MNKISSIFILFFFLQQTTHTQLPPTDSSWELEFIDEFGSIYPKFIIDSSKWDRFFRGDKTVNTKFVDAMILQAYLQIAILTGISYYTQWYDSTTNSLQVDTVGSDTLKIIARK